MFTGSRGTQRLVVLVAAAAAGVALTSAATTAAPARQAPACRWDKLAVTTPQALYFTGAAWDTIHHRLYLNGGLDSSGTSRRAVQAVDLSDPDLAKVSARTLAPSGPVQDFWGTAGAFRAVIGSPDPSAALFWGGGEGAGRGTSEGTGQNLLQTYLPAGNTWTAAAAGANGVVLAAAAAAPDKDLVAWVGGVKECDFFNVSTGDPLACRDAQNQTTLVTFDPATGAPRLQAGPTGGPARVFGGTLVYDSRAQRMLYFGGVDNAESGRARNTTFALDLTDPAKASWSALTVTGQLPPARAFHTAAYDDARQWMVINGGVTQGFFGSDESVLSDTWALDLGVTPARWVNLAANTPGERVGAAMAFDGQHQVTVLVGGRRTFGGTAGQQSVNRDIFALTCGTVPAATVTPGGPTVTATLPPPLVATHTPGPGPATATPGPSAPGAQACPQLAGWKLVPDAVIADALANPGRYYGWQRPNNPAVPPGPYNPLRVYLGLMVVAKPYHPLFNSVVWKAGCP